MSPDDALHRTALDFPGGVESLHQRLGIKVAYSTFANQLNPNMSNTEPSFKLARRIMLMANDFTALDAQCREAGGLFIPLGGFDEVSDETLFNTLTALNKEFGDVSQSLSDAMKDNRIDSCDVERLDQQVYELTQAAQALVARVRQLAEAEKARGG